MATTISNTTVSSISLVSGDSPLTLTGTNSFTNNATITTSGSPATTAGFGSYFGIYGAAGGDWTITNTGTLLASGTTARVNGGGAVTGSKNAAIGIAGAGGTASATGTIVNDTNAVISAANRGIIMYGSGVVDNRAGATITSNIAVGIVGQSGTLLNAGTVAGSVVITANINDPATLFSTAVVTNSGVLNGSVSFNRRTLATVTNSGTVTIASGTAMAVSGTSALNLVNQATGIVQGSNGLSVSSSTAASTISNLGRIVGTSGAGLNLTTGPGNVLTNATGGTISGSTTGAVVGGLASSVTNQSGATIAGGVGVVLSGGTSSLDNLGRVSASLTGIILSGASISATNASTGLVTGTTGFSISGAGVVLSNSGQVSGTTTGLRMTGSSGSITNTGSIGGTTGVYFGSGTTATLTNTGTINATDTAAGYAVRFVRTSSLNRLITNADGVLGGKLSLGTGLLELATNTANTVGTIAGFGGMVTNVGTIQIDSGASWVLGGSKAGLTGTVINGFDADDQIVLSDFVAVSETFDGTNLVLTDAGSNQTTLTVVGTFTASDIQLTSGVGSSTVSLLCFCKGTCIATPTGQVMVQDLRVGDMVLTNTGQARPITWIGSSAVSLRRGNRTAATPIIIRKHAFDRNVPFRDLRVTKGHAFLFDGALIPAEFLVNNRSILWDDNATQEKVFHIELDTHDVVLANGAPAESYRDDGNRALFATASHDAMPRHLPCAPVLTEGALVDAVWTRLLARSGTRSNRPVTHDPDLHLLIDGQRVDPVDSRKALSVFKLPGGAETARIVSRTAVPTELGIGRDARELGVAVRRIVARRGARFTALDAEAMPKLGGFHAMERDGNGAFCWTDGQATLPRHLWAGTRAPVDLFLHLSGTTTYPLA